ncbi:MAG: spermidine synthase [Roseiarcus sp.]
MAPAASSLRGLGRAQVGRALDNRRARRYLDAMLHRTVRPGSVMRAGAVGALLAFACLAPAQGLSKEPRVLVETKESLYNKIYIYRENDLVFMTFGLNKALFIESAANVKDEFELPAPYTRFMTAGLAYARSLDSILEIGSGGGRTAWYLHRSLPGLPITSVELDPAVIALSHKYFGTRDEANFSQPNEDGRQFLSHGAQRYDVILLDAYHGPFIPFHLLTREFYGLVKRRLAEGGVVVQNMDPSSALFDSVVRTIATAFAQIDLFVADDNVVLVAYDGEPRSPEALAELAEVRQRQFKFRYSLVDLVKERRRIARADPTIDSSAKVLTDDFAPVDALRAIERHNRQWPALSPP